MTPAEELLLAALETKHGIAVKSTDIEHLRRHLQQARKTFRSEGHKQFDCLSFRTAPDSLTELWIVKSNKDEPDVRLGLNGTCVEAAPAGSDQGPKGT